MRTLNLSRGGFVSALSAGALWLASAHASLAADDDPLQCQTAGWDMAHELKAYSGEARRVFAGSATANIPIVRDDTLYVLALSPQSAVHLIQESPNAPRAAASMGGLAKFTVPKSGGYRVTVDTALWIDAVDSTRIVPPARYNTWHQCALYRKSVEFRLVAGHTIVFQFSGATAAAAKVTIEPTLD